MTLGGKVKKARKEMGFTQTQLAEKVGVSTKRKIVFIVGIVLCLCLCACSGREVSTSGSASEQIPSESSPSQVVESLEEPDVSQNTISEPEVVQFEIALHPAAFNEYGHLIVNHENTDTVIVDWTPVSGYAEVDASKTTDQFSPGIQNAEGRLVLDYLRIIHTEGIDVIDYESNIPMRLELFSQVVNSKNYKHFISAMTNGGGGWVNKNRISDDGSTNYGYLFDCKVKLTENDFLNFHYYFQSDKRYQSYDEVPDEVKGELIALIDSFSLHKPQNDTADNTSSPETFLEIINTEYLPIFGSLINCDDWNAAEEIPVSMYYDWYRDYINSVTTHEERIEQYKLNSDINSPGWAYPSEEFESHVKQYFDVSTEYLRESSDIYQTDEDVYWAGGGNNITYRTKVESSEDIDVKDGLLVIRVACSLLGDFSDTIYKNLVVDISGEQVKFVSCVEETGGNDISPQNNEQEHKVDALFHWGGTGEEQQRSISLYGPAGWEGRKGGIDSNGKKLVELTCYSPQRMENRMEQLETAEKKEIGGKTFWLLSEEYDILEKPKMVPYIIWRYYYYDGELYYGISFFQNQEEMPISLDEFESVLATMEIHDAEA